MSVTPHDALKQVLAAGDRSLCDEDEVGIEGEEPVLATRFRLGTAGAAAIAAAGLAAADLWRLRGGAGSAWR